MNNTQIFNHQTINATDIRFNLGKILEELGRKRSPVLIISRSKPKAWLYPYETTLKAIDLFAEWQNKILPKYKKIKAKTFIKIIRQDREREERQSL